ncbi:MAG: hypothetical protein JWQ76_4544 [Ramlibacter sp.]|nr:hypothetical protein [Ramlibacter sp.]
MTVAATYEDAGRSGVSLKYRPAMRQLLQEVTAAGCPYSVVLVYDVSRWGRFEDTDASAYYEYHCRLNGVDVVYVRETFPADRSPMAVLLKNLKRAMAAEYSRELGVKTRAGQAWALTRGYQMGALPCIGFRRLAVSSEGRTKRLLEPLERKSYPTDRIRWVLGPPDEVELAKSVFLQYATTQVSMEQITKALNALGAVSHRGLRFKVNTIANLLSCEAFIGNFVWGRRDDRTGLRRCEDDPAFQRLPAVLPALVSREIWDRVQWKRAHPQQPARISREGIIEKLRIAVRRNPALRAWELTAYECPSESVLRKEFGSFVAAVRLAGRDDSISRDTGSRCRMEHICLTNLFSADLLRLLRQNDIRCEHVPHRTGALQIGDCTRLWVRLIWKQATSPLAHVRWYVNKGRCKDCHYVLLARMLENKTAADFVLLTDEEYRQHSTWLEEGDVAVGVRLQSANDLVARLRGCSGQIPAETSSADRPAVWNVRKPA